MSTTLPSRKGLAIIGGLTAIATVTIIAFSLRVYVRLRLVKRMTEDWVAGFGCLLYLIFYAMAILGLLHGIGEHTDRVPVTEYSTALKV